MDAIHRSNQDTAGNSIFLDFHSFRAVLDLMILFRAEEAMLSGEAPICAEGALFARFMNCHQCPEHVTIGHAGTCFWQVAGVEAVVARVAGVE